MILDLQELRRTPQIAVILASVFAATSAMGVENSATAFVAQIISPSATYSFHDANYIYSVQWGFMHAGTSTVHLQWVNSGLQVTATADSAGMPDKFFKVHDRFIAAVDPHTFCTLRVNKHNEEGSHRRELNIALDYPHRKSHVELKDLKTSETKVSDFDIPACVTDVISGFFYVASLPLASGYTQIFPINDNGKTSDVKVTVEGHDIVKNPGGQFQTLRVKAEPIAGAMKGKGTLWVWFTDDARHAPVQMKSKLTFATFSFQLQRMEIK